MDGRSDIFSLGLVGFRMLAGRLPFESSSVGESLARRLAEDAPPLRSIAPDVPEDLAAAIDRCLSRDPKARWPDGRSLRDALGAVDGAGESTRILEAVESSAFWYTPAALVAMLATAVVLSYASYGPLRPADLLWGAGVMSLLAVVPIQRLRAARAAGASWRRVMKAALWPPRGWIFWYPAVLRRPDDLWSRLPVNVRRYRTFVTLVVPFALGPVLGLAFVGLLFSSGEFSAAAFNAVLTLCFGPLLFFPGWALVAVAVGWSVRRWGRREGLSPEEAARLALYEPTTCRPFWSRPMVKRLLLAVPRPLSSPRQCLDAVVRAARDGHGTQRDLASSAVEPARGLIARLEAVDVEVGRLGDAGAGQLERIAGDLGALRALLNPSLEQQRMKTLLEEQATILRGLQERREALARQRALITDALQALARAVEAGSEAGTSAAAVDEACRRARSLVSAGLPLETDDVPTMPHQS